MAHGKPKIRLARLLLHALAAVLLLSACGDAPPQADPGWPGYTEGPNEGRGWVGFTYPYGPVVETTDPSIAMGGSTFIPAAATCPGWEGDLGPDYRVTWYNAANGLSGGTNFGLNCLTIVFAWWEAPPGMIPLQPGENIITITASDGLGNIGRASMTVFRR